jgi:hypothetical protein
VWLVAARDAAAIRYEELVILPTARKLSTLLLSLIGYV